MGDSFDDLWADMNDFNDCDSDLEIVTCKYCGVSGLVWGKQDGDWMLFRLEDNRQHRCNRQILAKREFRRA